MPKKKPNKKNVIQKKGDSNNTNTGRRNQENLSNRGYSEDQPGNPIRSTGSTKKSQESLPTGEPDKNDSPKLPKNNKTGPGLG